MTEMEMIIKEWEEVLSRDPLDAPWNLIDETIALLKEQESTLNRLRSTMEDMVRGNASEEVSYLLRLLDKWE